jgi:hypothetical protein
MTLVKFEMNRMRVTSCGRRRRWRGEFEMS